MSQLKTKIAVIYFAVATFFVAGCSRNNDAAENARIEAAITEQLNTAKNLLFNDNSDQALLVLEALDADYPNRADIIEQLAFAYNDVPDYDMAGIYFDRVYEIDPTRSDISLFAAEAHTQAENWPAAAAAYTNYLADEPLDAGTWKRLAQAHRNSGKLQPSLDAWLRAFKSDKSKPNVTEAVELGNLFYELGNNSQAYNWWEYALKLPDADGAHTTALIGQLRLALAQEKWTDAELIVALLSDTAPNALDRNGLGGVRQQLADLRETTNIVIPTTGSTTAGTGTTVVTTTTTDMGNASDDDGETSKLSVLEDDEANTPEDIAGTITVDSTGTTISLRPDEDGTPPVATETVVLATVERDSPDGPVVTKLSVLEDDETTSDIAPTPLTTEVVVTETERVVTVQQSFFDQGTAAVEAADYPQAIRFLQLSLANENPDNALAFYDLSRAYYGIEQWQQAELYASEALRRQPDNLFFMVQYLRVLQKSQTRQRLMTEMVRAHEQFPNSPDIALALARGYDHIERNPRNARIMYLTFLKLAPENHPKREEIQNYLGVQ